MRRTGIEREKVADCRPTRGDGYPRLAHAGSDPLPAAHHRREDSPVEAKFRAGNDCRGSDAYALRRSPRGRLAVRRLSGPRRGMITQVPGPSSPHVIVLVGPVVHPAEHRIVNMPHEVDEVLAGLAEPPTCRPRPPSRSPAIRRRFFVDHRCGFATAVRSPAR
jgi:hypothetical protein